MANQVEKLDTIAIADIEKVNTLTDDNIEKINTLEFTGTSTYELFAWGDGGGGSVGDGTVTNRSSPVQIGTAFFGELDVTDVYATECRITNSDLASAAVKADGTLWTWGSATYGQLGHNNTTNYSSPVQVGSLTDWRSVTNAKTQSMCATKTDGTLWGWGDNDANGHSSGIYSSPVQVGTDTDWSPYLGAGNTYCYCLKTNGELWMWGKGGNAFVGAGTALNSPGPPIQVTDKYFTYIGAGPSNAIAGVEKTTGKMYSWGTNNGWGMLGFGDTSNSSSPVQMGTATDWAWAGGGASSMVFGKTNGEGYGAGRNDNGFLGTNNVTTYSSPVQASDKSYANAGHGCAYNRFHAITTDGALWSIGGSGGDGTSGTGETAAQSSPVQVGTLTDWICISNAGGGGRTTSSIKLAIRKS